MGWKPKGFDVLAFTKGYKSIDVASIEDDIIFVGMKRDMDGTTSIFVNLKWTRGNLTIEAKGTWNVSI